MRRDGQAWRSDDRRHPQPHAEEFRPRHRRCRICPALVAARHASVGQVRQARGVGKRDRAHRPAGDRRARRHLQSLCRPMAIVVGYGCQLHAGGATPEAEWRRRMILELVEFNSPKGWSRRQVAEEARNVIPKWRANKELLRKHFVLELNGKTGAGINIWPLVAAAQRAHDQALRRSLSKCSCGATTMRYFSLFILIDKVN